MTTNLYSFTGQGNSDPSQAGYNQYVQQGQAQLNPAQSVVAASNPVAAAAQAGLAKNLAMIQQQNQQLPAQGPPTLPTSPATMAQGAAANPNVNGQNMGGVGPTPQNLALAQQLMQPSPPVNPTQQLLNPASGS